MPTKTNIQNLETQQIPETQKPQDGNDLSLVSEVRRNIENILIVPNNELSTFWNNIFGTEIPENLNFKSNEEFLDILNQELDKHVKDITDKFFSQEKIIEYKGLLNIGNIDNFLKTILQDFQNIRSINIDKLKDQGFTDEQIKYKGNWSSWPSEVNKTLITNCYYSSLIGNELFEKLGFESKLLNIPRHTINYVKFGNGEEYLIDMQNNKFKRITGLNINLKEPIEIIDFDDLELKDILLGAPKGLLFNDKKKAIIIMFGNLRTMMNKNENGEYGDEIAKELSENYEQNSNGEFFKQICNIWKLFSEYRNKRDIIDKAKKEFLMNKIKDIINEINMSGISLKIATKKEEFQRINDSGLGVDSRIKFDLEDLDLGNFEFNKNKITSLTVYIENDKNEIIGTSSIVITPKKVFKNENKYFKKEQNNLKLLDFEMLDFGEIEYLITHAWTKVRKDQEGRLIHKLLKPLKKILEEVQKNAPKNTGIEIVAMGQNNSFRNPEYQEVIDNIGIGNNISFEKLPFSEEIFGIPDSGSRSTASYAEYLGLNKLENIAQYKTLGPVYFKRIN